ncbi:flagellar M-ring protein [Andreesenia angusta]|uniref:Flagellar M-ring protein n=1 Tax=Andreesenia angusta TaxID=39480 RepID=A0A1S1V837_9FIRM|nr:flagellar basal-body MS-ring/collar protein FliF [Andreesenia angusta]OHW62752.1 flagellar M-ring protein [Andreesenia angusta]
MGDLIEKIKNQLNSFWSGTEKKRKVLIISGLAVILIAISSAIFFLTRTEYVVLYDNLSLKEAGAITASLDEQGILWKEGKDGTELSVPANMKDKAKINLAVEGLPEERYDFDQAFQDMDWTTTEYDKKQKLKYALENSLSKDIASMDGIEKAEVRLTIPEESGYVIKNDSKPTGSVYLTIDKKSGIKADAISGIQHLVANAVNGMNAMDVSIVGNDGQLLSEQSKDGESVDMSDQVTAQQAIQEKLDNSIRGFLENAFGRGKVDVRTSVKMNFDSEVENITEYESPFEGGEEGIARSVEEMEENSSNTTEGEVPGVEPNAEDQPADFVEVEGQNQEYSKNEKVTNYEINERNRQIKKEPGQIESVTVAVLIDEKTIGDGLTDDKREEISNLIYAATGIKTEQVEVSAMAFGDSSEGEESAEEEAAGVPIWVFALIGAGVLAIGLIAFILYRRKKKREEELALEEAKRLELEAMVDETMEYMEDDIEFGVEKSRQKDQIAKFIDQKPEIIAQLLRTWINEE